MYGLPAGKIDARLRNKHKKSWVYSMSIAEHDCYS